MNETQTKIFFFQTWIVLYNKKRWQKSNLRQIEAVRKKKKCVLCVSVIDELNGTNQANRKDFFSKIHGK